MFTMGCLGEAAAASLMMDQTSCFWPDTLAAGLILLLPSMVLLNRLKVRDGVGLNRRLRKGCASVRDMGPTAVRQMRGLYRRTERRRIISKQLNHPLPLG
uniref:Uncharacterized protein n=1 Tax=Photinus pyralis TaxID=7054 RepID=A0A1Y1K7D1_PHOPY